MLKGSLYRTEFSIKLKIMSEITKTKKNELKFYKLFKTIAEDEDLNLDDKLVVSVIYTSIGGKVKCIDSNELIAKKLGMTISQVEKSLKKLETLMYIKDSRKDPLINVLQILKLEICNEKYYKFYNLIVERLIPLRAKFLFVYILSLDLKKKIFNMPFNNIIKDIGLSKHHINEATIELLVYRLLGTNGVSGGKRKYYLDYGDSLASELTGLSKKGEIINRKSESNFCLTHIDKEAYINDIVKIENKIKKGNWNKNKIIKKIHPFVKESALTEYGLRLFKNIEFNFNSWKSLECLNDNNTLFTNDELNSFLITYKDYLKEELDYFNETFKGFIDDEDS